MLDSWRDSAAWTLCLILLSIVSFEPRAAGAAPAPGQQARQEMTVAELRQFLQAQYAADRNDGRIAGRLGSIELKERLSETTLERMIEELKPGEKSALALEMLADASALLDPPASELPVKDPPDLAAQRSMIDSAIRFAAVSLRHLPDFLATRSTRSFDNSPLLHLQFGSMADAGVLHPVGTFNRQIAYRNGQEVPTKENGKQTKQDASSQILSTYGEFGVTLATILVDADHGKIVWSHWEQTSAGVAAVFHYEVPAGASHYAVEYCCRAPAMDRGQSARSGLANSYRGTPPYHGSLLIDPSTGDVLRYTLETELKPSDPITRSAIWVQYGKVDIGDTSYLCPVQSGAIALVHRLIFGSSSELVILEINKVAFTNYHRFGSTSRILAPGGDQPQ